MVGYYSHDSSRPEAVRICTCHISVDEMLWFLGKTDDVHTMRYQPRHLYISVSLATCLFFSRIGQFSSFRTLVHPSSLV